MCNINEKKWGLRTSLPSFYPAFPAAAKLSLGHWTFVQRLVQLPPCAYKKPSKGIIPLLLFSLPSLLFTLFPTPSQVSFTMVQIEPVATTDLLPIVDLGLYLRNPDSAEAIAECKRVIAKNSGLCLREHFCTVGRLATRIWTYPSGASAFACHPLFAHRLSLAS